MTTTIRPVSDSDAEQIAMIYAPYVRDTAISFELDPPPADEMRARIAKTIESHPWLVCADDARVLGYAYAGKHRDRAAYRWSIDVSVYVDGAAHGRGIGRALYTALLPLVVAQGYRTAYAGITLPNAASVGLHEAVGFRLLAVYRGVGFKLGAWHDVGWWELELRARDAAPAEPLTLAAVQGTAEWDAALARGQALLGAR